MSSHPTGATSWRRVLVAASLWTAASFASANVLHAQPSPLAVRAIDAAPFPTAMVASPRADAVAWVQNAEGARSVWVANAPAYTARRVALFANDDGQELGELAFSADGRSLWFTRGGGPNRAGESPNPSSDPKGGEQAIWRVRLDTAGVAPVRIAEGSHPLPAPMGDAFVFTRRGQVMTLATTSGGTEPAPLFRMRGAAAALWWSPDGSKLAVVLERGTHAFVGVYDIKANTLSWMAPSTDHDASPVWSPDGKRLAFVRVPYAKDALLFTPVRRAQPWSVLVADVATGKATERFRASEGTGSAFSEVDGAQQLWWTADDRLVVPWERDGFRHLYSMAANGGAWTQLETGTHEIEQVSSAPDGRSLIVMSNQHDLDPLDRDRRHLWRVFPAGGAKPIPLTGGAGIEWAPTPLANGSLAFLASGAQQPAHAAISITGGARRMLAPETLPASFPSMQLVVPTPVEFKAADGITSYGQLFLPPKGAFSGKRPAIVFVHGGSRRQMLLGWHYLSYYNHAYAMNQALASRGWIVVSLNYRSGVGYGLGFREALKYGASGASEYGDLVAAAKWLRARTDVDTAKVALWGGSYGGYMTAMGLTRNPELFAAGVDVHGVHDWNVGIATFVPDYNPLENPAQTKLAFTSSPMAQVKRWKAPVLLIHGDDDRNVRFIETLSLIEQLRAQRVPVEQLVLPDEVHLFLRHDSFERAYEAALDFLTRRVVR